MRSVITLILLCSFSAGCRSLTGDEVRGLHGLVGTLDFFQSLGECLLDDDEEPTSDEPGWITPAHPKD